MPELEVLAPFVAGLASTAHCVGMCGPLALAAGAAGGPGRGPALYLAGKTTSYLFLGTALAFGGGVIGMLVSPLVLRALLLVTGVFFLLHGLEMLRPGLVSARVRADLGVPPLVRGLATRLREAGGAPAALGLGVVSGLLPCPLSWGVAAWAAGTGHPLAGGVVMLSFGLGTAPGLLLVASLGTRLEGPRRVWLRRFAGLAWALVGAWLAARGAGAWLASCHGA